MTGPRTDRTAEAAADRARGSTASTCGCASTTSCATIRPGAGSTPTHTGRPLSCARRCCSVRQRPGSSPSRRPGRRGPPGRSPARCSPRSPPPSPPSRRSSGSRSWRRSTATRRAIWRRRRSTGRTSTRRRSRSASSSASRTCSVASGDSGGSWSSNQRRPLHPPRRWRRSPRPAVTAGMPTAGASDLELARRGDPPRASSASISCSHSGDGRVRSRTPAAHQGVQQAARLPRQRPGANAWARKPKAESASSASTASSTSVAWSQKSACAARLAPSRVAHYRHQVGDPRVGGIAQVISCTALIPG